MFIKKASLLFAALFFFAFQTYAQQPDPGNKSQMRELAVSYCTKTSNASVCNCFADALVKSFNEKEWRIFIADTSSSSAPPSGISQTDLDNYGQKLANAGNACGMQ